MKKVILFSNGKLGNTIRKMIENINSVSLILHVTEDSSETNEKKMLYNPKKHETLRFLENYDFDFILAFNWRHRFPSEIVKKYEVFNIHPSLLPKYRGSLPIMFQLLNKEKHSGVTIHRMDEKFDTGPIVIQEKFNMNDNETYTTMIIKIVVTLKRMLKVFLNNVNLVEEIKGREQDGNDSSYYGCKDLSLFTITKNTSYEEFIRISRILQDRFPLIVQINGEFKEIISYSLDYKEDLTHESFSLSDKKVYLLVKDCK